MDSFASECISVWRDVYKWFDAQASHLEWRAIWNGHANSSSMIAQDTSIRGTLAMFTGFHFDKENPHAYREAKHWPRLLGDKLQSIPRLIEAEADPKGSGRTAMSGRSARLVWDYNPLEGAPEAAALAHYPHLAAKPHIK